jgi:hypothetical protein
MGTESSEAEFCCFERKKRKYSERGTVEIVTEFS